MDPDVACAPDVNIIAPFVCGSIIVLICFFGYCWWNARKERKERRDAEWQRVPLNKEDVHDPGLQVENTQLQQIVNTLKRENENYKTTCRIQQKSLESLGVISYITTELTDPRQVNVIQLRCIHLQMDRAKCNSRFTHINTDGELVNAKSSDVTNVEGNLKKYWGTSSTTPLPWFRSPQYFEVEARVYIREPLKQSDLLLEIGLSTAEQQDVSHNIQGKPQTYSMNVAHCTTHKTICRNGWRHGREMQCLPQTMKNVYGHTSTLHFGVVYDHSRGRVVFLDAGRMKTISIIDGVDNSAVLWPMFGVFYPQRGTINMSLVVSTDINMTNEKKSLIMEALHERYTEY